jgi:hypothetical protein
VLLLYEGATFAETLKVRFGLTRVFATMLVSAHGSGGISAALSVNVPAVLASIAMK